MQFCITHTLLRVQQNHSRLNRSVYTKVVFGNLGKTVAWGHATVKGALLWCRHHGKCFWWWLHNAITMSSRDCSTMQSLIVFTMPPLCIQAMVQHSNCQLLCCISELWVVHHLELHKNVKFGYYYPCHKGRQNRPILWYLCLQCSDSMGKKIYL